MKQQVAHIKKIDHIAIATDNMEKSLDFFVNQLGLPCAQMEQLPDRGIQIAMIPIGDTRIELVAPLHSASEISGFLEKKGPGLHHIAFETEQIKSDMQVLSTQTVRFTSQAPAPGAHQSQVAFIHPKSTQGVLVELVEHAKKH